jgi:hypothetical protein
VVISRVAVEQVGGVNGDEAEERTVPSIHIKVHLTVRSQPISRGVKVLQRDLDIGRIG